MAAVAQGARGALRVGCRIELRPPVGPHGNVVRTPHLVIHVPLRTEREVVVADFLKVALFPFGSVNEGDIFLLESEKRIRLCKIREDDLRVQFWIGDYVGHARLTPAIVNGWMAGLAVRGTDVLCSEGLARRRYLST